MMDWLAAAERHREEMVRLTCGLVAIDTENPPGRRYEECAVHLERSLAALDLEPERIGPGPCLSAVWGSGDRALYLHGHYDVVPAQDRAQFEPRVEGGRIWGRGTADMKGGLAAMLYGLVVVRDAGVPIDGRVVLNIVPDEETGGPGGSAWLAPNGRLLRDGPAAGMLIAEPTGGVVWNASRGAVSLRVTVRGREAHVGLTHEGDNAFERLLAIAGRIVALRAELPEGSILLVGGSASSGSNFNVVPARASFTVDRRPNPDEDVGEERDRLEALLDELRAVGHEIEVETLQHADSGDSARETPLGRALADSVERVHGARAAFEMCPGVLETRWYAREGVPAYAYGPGALEVAHGPDEHLEVDAMVRCAAVYAGAIADVLTS